MWNSYISCISPFTLFSHCVVSDSAAPRTAACQTSPSLTISLSFRKPMCPLSQWCHPTILSRRLLLLPSIFPNIRVFSSELALRIRWPKYWSFSFSISPSSEYSGLISFKIDWFDFLAVEGTLKSLLQHHSSKSSILWCSAFFMVQFSHPYMTSGKNIPLTIWSFVRKVLLRFLLCCLGLLYSYATANNAPPFFFGGATRLAGSYSPDQWLNQDHSRESSES